MYIFPIITLQLLTSAIAAILCTFTFLITLTHRLWQSQILSNNCMSRLRESFIIRNGSLTR